MKNGSTKKRSPNAYSLSNYIQRIETYLIREAMARHAGNVCHTARALGMGYTTLQWKLKKMMIDPNEYRNQVVRGGSIGVDVGASECEATVTSPRNKKNQTINKQLTQSDKIILKKLEGT